MNISITTILAKMANEIHEAQSHHNMQQIREHAAVIRALCDLILERSNEEQTANTMPNDELIKLIQPSSASNERIEIGDDANGPSLFDF
ncbi:MAG TPA: YwdI family protein [Anoxybacillus sp.]|nr:YwdI family protein [Anoxybacillus sp.]